MSSTAQIVANQNNALASTGPRSDAGKAASSQNALKYGLTAAEVVLSFEDPAAYEALHTGFIEQFLPATSVERLLVDEATAAHWQKLRVQSARKAYVEAEMGKLGRDEAAGNMALLFMDNWMAKFHKYETAYHRRYESAWKKLAVLQKERKAAEQPSPARTPKPNLQNKPNFDPPQPVLPPVMPAATRPQLAGFGGNPLIRMP